MRVFSIFMALMLAAGAAWAQDYPSRPIRWMVPVTNTPQAFSALIASDLERFGKIIRDTGIKVE